MAETRSRPSILVTPGLSRPVSRHATVTKMPGTNQDVDVLIPEVWIEYEDGTTKPLELEGLHQGAHGIDIYPLGPITFSSPADADDEGAS